MKSGNFFAFLLKCTHREHVHNLDRVWAPSILYIRFSVRLYQINFKTAESIGPKFSVERHVIDPMKGLRVIKFFLNCILGRIRVILFSMWPAAAPGPIVCPSSSARPPSLS